MFQKLSPFLFVGLSLSCFVQGLPGADGGGGAPPAPAPAAPTTRAARAAAIRAEADAPTPPAPAPNGGEGGTPAPSGADDPKAKSAADRAARIQAMRDKQREAATKQQAHRARRAEQEELTQLRQLKAEWEKKDSAFATEEEFLAAAEKRGISAEKVISYFRDASTNPSAIAERKASAAKSDMQKQLDEMRQELRERDERDAQSRTEAEHQQKSIAAAKSYIDLAQSKADDAPLVARMIERHGADVAIAFANKFIVPLMGDGFDITDADHLASLHDHMEQFLSETQLSDPTPAQANADTSSKANAGKKNGEKPVTTLSNRTVTERGTVEQEIPLAKLPLSERKRLLKEKYEREDA